MLSFIFSLDFIPLSMFIEANVESVYYARYVHAELLSEFHNFFSSCLRLSCIKIYEIPFRTFPDQKVPGEKKVILDLLVIREVKEIQEKMVKMEWKENRHEEQREEMASRVAVDLQGTQGIQVGRCDFTVIYDSLRVFVLLPIRTYYFRNNIDEQSFTQ